MLNLVSVFALTVVYSAARHAVIFAIRAQIERAGDTVAVVEERGGLDDVHDIFVGEAVVAQGGDILIADGGRVIGDFDGQIEHGALARRQIGGAIVGRDRVGQHFILGANTQHCAVRGQAVEAMVLGRYRHRDHLALGFG